MFHRVTSLTPSVGINSWTGGLNRDAWLYLMGDGSSTGGAEVGASGGGSEDGAAGGATEEVRLRRSGLGGGRWTAACADMAGTLRVLICTRDAFAALLAAIDSDTAASGPRGADAEPPSRARESSAGESSAGHAPRRLLSVRATALLEARYLPIAHRLETPGAPMAAAARVADHCRIGGGEVRTWAAWSADPAIIHSALALELLSEAERDLALDDLLDHTAAWAASQAVGLDEEVDGAAVKAFLSECCAK